VKGDTLGKPRYSDEAGKELFKLQHDRSSQLQIWDYFTAIIPADQRERLDYYIVATDGRGGVLASVEQFSGLRNTWALVVDPADAGKPRDLTATLLHEFGHMLTLNSSQVYPDEAVLENPNDPHLYEQQAASCPQYFARVGCSQQDSYINKFFQQFWTKLYPEWSKVNAARNKKNYLPLLARFYSNHHTQFITPYSATSPEEDMAETWAYFILNPRPADDSTAHRKVLFYYDYPELVDLRTEIIAGICKYSGSR
jgi:hypothetical protein